MNTVYKINGLDYNTVKSRRKDKKTYINIACSFDIESTSTYIGEDEKVAFMYAWVFTIKDENFIYRGRTWDDFLQLCEALENYFKLTEDRVLVVYIHNLGFEFQFMRKYFEWSDIFAIDNRRPLKALTKGGIEFRDSLILSGMNLKTLAKNLVHHKIEKQVGDLDYSLIRHHETDLSEAEWQYIEYDALIVLYYITEQLSIYKSVDKLPLTNTSRVREYVKNNCYNTNGKRDKYKSYKYRNLMKDLQLDKPTYVMSRTAFQGGYVHANANKTGHIIKDVYSMDLSSSYPAVMVSEMFPMSKPFKMKVDENFDLDEARKKYNLIFTVRFKNIISKFPYENYISESHCQRLIKPISNNGRVFSAEELITTITDVDFEIISKVYDWDDMQLANVYGFYKAYLPKPIIESIMELYEMKTQLKGVKGEEVEYVLSKGMLNSIYGMTVTDISKGSSIYNEDDRWDVSDVSESELEEIISKYNGSYNRFLYYPWGVFITAYARRNLWQGILVTGEDYIYSDTDAIKFTNYDKYKWFIDGYNQRITKKVQRMCKYHNLDPKRFQPKTIEGVVKPIGIWELDGHYSMFKTLGAKRYMVEHADTKELHLTCSGLKDNGLQYLKKQYKDNITVMENFDDDLFIPAEETGSMSHTYIDHKCILDVTDHHGKTVSVTTLSGVHLEGESFTLSMTDTYLDFIHKVQNGYIYSGRKRLN